jgi:L-ascorbate metabolism protein UlaG (beta-lactamase superfamily)
MTSDDPRSVRLTHIGGPTVLVEVGGWRILSDPTFDPPGDTYGFGWGTRSTKTVGPALDADDLGRIDVVVVSHDHHGDNLDRAGRELLGRATHVVTNPAAARRLGGGSVGLPAWSTTTLRAPDRPDLRITATPCRHGPPLSRPIVGEVVGFLLDLIGGDEQVGTIWITGDSVLHRGLREVAQRAEVDVAVVHLGQVRFPITGPATYSMTAADGVELMTAVRPRVAVPVHFDGWSHFQEGRDVVAATIAAAPADVRDRFQLLDPGVATEVGPIC